MKEKKIKAPRPVVNEREIEVLKRLENRYKRLTEPNGVIKIARKVGTMIPRKVQNTAGDFKKALSEQDFVKQALKYAAEGFSTLEDLAAKMTISEQAVIKKTNKRLEGETISSIDEMCCLRAYDIERMVQNYKNSNILTAAAEGALTGALGFVGLIPNLVASLFLYFRAVQSVAIHYGYDVKNDPAEMEIASGVLMNAISPANDIGNNELTATVGKFIVFTETTAVRQTAGKTWAAMAERGGASLLITQVRALANKAAEKALNKVGAKGIENTVFRGMLEQIGRKLALKKTAQMMPVVGGVFGALFDTAQMKRIVNFADIFYCKRFIEEKNVRVNMLLHPEDVGTVEDYIDVDSIDVE